jgi:HD-GYP domain-containing protein (c-di-GMP phosphodiesterase class II)
MTATQLPDSEAKNTSPTAGYLPVQIAMLQRLNQTTVDLFVQYERNNAPLLYHRAGCPLEAGITEKLREGGIDSIYVRSDDFQFFGAHLLEVVDSLADQSTISPGERFAALQLAMAVEIEHAARLIDCGPYVTVATKMGRELTSLLVNSDALPHDLFRLARHDFNTFTHVTNVASYGVLLAERLQLCPENQLEQLAKAAILHDLGKRFIPAKILSKPAKLDPEERAIIETHPQRGYEELCARGELTFDQLMIVYQHHERVDGTGYPVGLEGDEIHPWARMLAVVDVFDAMTGVRPYRRAATSAEAMGYITKSAGTHFDAEMVKCWSSMMAKS